MANLDDNALDLAKELLLARSEDPSAKGLIVNLRQLLVKSNLPSIATLLRQHPSKPETWKKFRKPVRDRKNLLTGFLVLTAWI